METTHISNEHPKLNEMNNLVSKLIPMHFNKQHLQVVEQIASMEAHEHLSSYIIPNNQIPNDNYPIWNALFEFDNWGDDFVKDNIGLLQAIGFVVIEPFNEFDWMLGFRGCGYSFYDAHWIPMYIDVFKNYEMIKLYEVAK